LRAFSYSEWRTVMAVVLAVIVAIFRSVRSECERGFGKSEGFVQ